MLLAVTLGVLVSGTPVSANGGGYHYGVANQGDAKLFEPTNLEYVEMRSEKLDIDLYYRFARVQIEYRLANTGTAPVTIEAGFPCEAYSDPVWWVKGLHPRPAGKAEPTIATLTYSGETDDDGEPVDDQYGTVSSRQKLLREPVLGDFQIRADGAAVPVTYYADASESAAIIPRILKSGFSESDAQEFEESYGMRLCWYTFKLDFKPLEERKILISYDAAYFGEVRDVSDDSMYSAPVFTYLFSPAAAWKGPIGTGEVTIRAVNTDPDLVSFNLPKRFKRSNNAWNWTFRNFEPGFADDLRLVIRPDSKILFRSEEETIPGYEYENSHPRDENQFVDVVKSGEQWYIYHTKYKIAATSTLKPQRSVMGKDDPDFVETAAATQTVLVRYDAKNLRQRFPRSPWAEGVPGDGIGEALTLTLDKPAPVYGIALFNGHHGSRDLFMKNNRVAEFEITVDDQPPFTVSIADEFISDEPWLVKFPTHSNKPAKKIRLEIKKVHRGLACRDTVLTKLQVVTRLSHPLELSHHR